MARGHGTAAESPERGRRNPQGCCVWHPGPHRTGAGGSHVAVSVRELGASDLRARAQTGFGCAGTREHGLAAGCWRGGRRPGTFRSDWLPSSLELIRAIKSGQLLKAAFLTGGTENLFDDCILPDPGVLLLISAIALHLLLWVRDASKA